MASEDHDFGKKSIMLMYLVESSMEQRTKRKCWRIWYGRLQDVITELKTILGESDKPTNCYLF